jgi:hypothetical protein
VPENVLQVGPQAFAVVVGLIVLLGGALAFAFKYHATNSRAGERGIRPADSEEDAERVSPDGFIDTFAGTVSEAGGGVPYTGWIIMGVVLVCYFSYLFLFWNPGR